MKGFTLIELLVVVLIIGILASVALPQYTKAVEKSRQSEAWTTMKSINDAVKIYQMEKGSETDVPTFGDLSIEFINSEGKAVSEGTSYSTKTFTYAIAKDGVIATRSTNGSFSYKLGLTHAGVRSCQDVTNGDCVKVGAKSPTDAACPTGMSSCHPM